MNGFAKGFATLFIAAAALCAAPAGAAIIFTPHLSEYAELTPGVYLGATLNYTSIDETWDASGKRIPLGNGAIPRGETIDASLLLGNYLWIGNLFADTHLPLLSTHSQFLRVILPVGRESATGAVNDLSRQFGQTSSSSGVGDPFAVAGLYGEHYHLGPLKGNGLYSVTVKAPIGEYNRDALLNIGTHYWSVIPQIGHHQEWFGRLFIDATAAYQYNGDNDSPAYGGLTPTRPADVYNLEGNFAWKFTQHWFADVGLSYYHSIGSNHYDQVTLNLKNQPVPATSACNALMIPAAQCTLTDGFYLAPEPGSRSDQGISNLQLVSGISYIYRAATVINLRAVVPLQGRGSEFTQPYDVYTSNPKGPNPTPPVAGGTQYAQLTGVQEAAAISATPFFELRVTFLLFAP
jgi:hypothetical protein